MKAPDKIYLQVCGECPEKDCKNCKFEDLEDNVTWCKDRIYKKDIEYIRKDALMEWVKKELESAELTNFDEFGRGEVITWGHILDRLNSM